MAIETIEQCNDAKREYAMSVANASVDKLQMWIVFAKLDVLKLCPNAELLYTVDRRGRKTHVGIYDAPPRELSDRGNYNSAKQYAPQLIGKKVAFRDSYPLRDVLHIIFELWMDALQILETTNKQQTISQLIYSCQR